MTRIVVGIDGSEDSDRALRCAIEEAELRKATLEVVYAVPEPIMLADPVLIPTPPREDLRASGMQLLDQVLDRVDTGGLEVERIVAIGNTSNVLCDAARGAELLVVGSRGFGGFRGLLVGSVTQQVVAHAPCPVLVVVPEDR